ncbi:tetratricopeptide repeat protein [Tumidithrix elongata RA019]|uniref:Tetratricopeptide repeat protein n=1 Tax=Tumidithrix elongata BACA0141 TaxID=2716417 RepID=A0AAW9Q7N0_9CYAN|nr:tetratricopeptide repeat protein [Tumidithrix elongata RA019]
MLEPIILASQAMMSRTSQQLSLAQACNLLGDLLLLTGKPEIAVQHHEKSSNISVNISTEYNDTPTINKIQSLRYSSLLNRGLCYLSLWEIGKAHNFFLNLEKLCNEMNQQELSNLGVHIFRVNSCLSLTYSLISDKKNTLLSINQVFANQTQHRAYSSQTRGYSSLFIAQAYKNIGYLEKSDERYQEALKYADESNCSQVKAIALYGVGELERMNHRYSSALSYIKIAIDILKKIWANPDRAEAFFQFGLTYQAMGEHDQAEEYKAKALELFEQMEAPKQIERVNKAFGGNFQ